MNTRPFRLIFGRVFTVLLVLAVTMSAQRASVPAQAQSAKPTFTKSACQFSLPGRSGQVEGKTYQCGTVSVPEDHKNPNGKTITLAVAVFKARTAKAQPDPVIYLEGGPGGFTLVQASDYIQAFGPLLASRDVILFDQRGVGFSTPALTCPELTDLAFQQLTEEISPEEAAKQQTATTLVCRKRLVASGINLAVYNSDQSAADVDAIREALGYQTYNLYGISYGTHLALVVMRDFPKPIRSVVIDSVEPLDADVLADIVPNSERVFKQLWTACAADTSCNTTYPNLEKVFYDTVDQLNRQPATVSASSLSGGPKYQVVVDGNALINFLFNSFYLTEIIPLLPALIYGAHAGRLQEIASILVLVNEETKTLSLGMYFSVECPEEAAFSNPQKAQAATQGEPQELVTTQLPSVQSEFDICNAWGTSAAPPIDHMAVKSPIPTLVMAGSFDPVTPPRYSKKVADELGNAVYVEVPNSGHGASLSGDCPFSVVIEFFNDPKTKPDSSCVSTIGPPKFMIKAVVR